MNPNALNHQKFKPRRKELRNTATDEEKIIWSVIKDSKLGFKFRRQTGIGPYIVDFFCAEKGVIVELDGSQHADAKDYDEKRDNYLRMQGCTVLRFWNGEVRKNLDNVLTTIVNTLNTTSPRFTRHSS